MGLALPHGGHLTHGMRINVSGKLYDVAAYEVSPETHRIDMDAVERIAHERRPKLILAGWSAYSRWLDFERFRAIADAVGAVLMVDMAHFAGLVAAGLHPNPVPYAEVVTTTVHKTLGGARGGLILCREEYARKINSAVFPGQQGGPLEHVIAGKAVALRIAGTEPFRERQERTIAGAKALADELLQAGHGVSVLTGGTDVHLVLVDLRDSELDGQQAEDRLHAIGITVNRNAVPFDPRPPAVVRAADRHLGARHSRPAAPRLRGDRAHHHPRPAARLRRGAGRARRARHRDRRPLPALLAARPRGAPRPSAHCAAARPRRGLTAQAPRRRTAKGSRPAASSAAVGRAAGSGSSAARTSAASPDGTRRPSGSGPRTSCGKRTVGSAASRAPAARGNGGRPASAWCSVAPRPKTSAGGPTGTSRRRARPDGPARAPCTRRSRPARRAAPPGAARAPR